MVVDHRNKVNIAIKRVTRIFKKLFIYLIFDCTGSLLLAMLAVCRLLIAMVSLVVDHGL